MLTSYLDEAMRTLITEHYRIDHLPEPREMIPSGYALHSILEDGYIAWGLPSKDAALGYAAALVNAADADKVTRQLQFSEDTHFEPELACHMNFLWGPDDKHIQNFIALAQVPDLDYSVPVFLDEGSARLLAKALQATADFTYVFAPEDELGVLRVIPVYEHQAPRTWVSQLGVPATREEAPISEGFTQSPAEDAPDLGKRTGTLLEIDTEGGPIFRLAIDDHDTGQLVDLIEAGLRCFHR